jgi:hypothetical protein
MEAIIPAIIPQSTAGLLSFAFTLSKYINTNIAINIASNPSLKRIKNELKNGVTVVSIIFYFIIVLIITVNENDYQLH